MMTKARRRNIIVLGLFGVLLFVFYMLDGDLPLSCPFKLLTSLPCPGCGGVRAASLLLHGHVSAAFYTNPLSVLLIFFFLLSSIWMLLDVFRNVDTYWKIFKIRWSKSAIFIAVTMLLINWIWNIWKGI